MARIYGRIAKIPAQLSYGLVNSTMGQIPCSTERISSLEEDAKQCMEIININEPSVELWALPRSLYLHFSFFLGYFKPFYSEILSNQGNVWVVL